MRRTHWAVLVPTVVLVSCSDHGDVLAPTATPVEEETIVEAPIVPCTHGECDLGWPWDGIGIATWNTDCEEWEGSVDSCDGGTGTGNNGSGYAPSSVIESNDTIPDCSGQPIHDEEKAWCAGASPNSSQQNAIQDALNAMKQLGGVCAQLADHGFAVLGNIRLFGYNNQAFSGAAGFNSSWILLADFWFNYTSSAHDWYGYGLQGILAHELDHSIGNTREHTDETQRFTTNTQACAG